MRYQAVLFDMDGTVLDTLDDLASAINAAMRQFGYAELTREQVRRYVGNGSRVLVERAAPEAGSERVEEILAWYKPYYTAHCSIQTRPYEGILPLMRTLCAAGLPLAIISNKPDRTVRELAEAFFPGLTALAVGENESAGIRRKPWPDMIDAAAARLGLAKKDCLYVGDSEVDIATARAAGMDCASVLWGFRSREELLEAGASRLFETPEELEAFILA